jgi:hypothetical protein
MEPVGVQTLSALLQTTAAVAVRLVSLEMGRADAELVGVGEFGTGRCLQISSDFY